MQSGAGICPCRGQMGPAYTQTVPPPPTGVGLVENDFVSVKLRMKRLGRTNRSFYRLNAIDSRTARDGRVIEELGWYDPAAKQPDKQLSLKRERIEYWLSVGAQPSDTVRELLKKNGIAAKKQ